MSEPGVYLRTYLQPFAPWLGRDDVTDIFVNRPGEVWVESLGGGLERIDAPELDETLLWRLARQIASLTHQGVSREHPLLAAVLPDGARVQVCAPPATRGPLALAIRKHVVADLGLDDYAAAGAFEGVRRTEGPVADAGEAELLRLFDAGDTAAFLRAAVRGAQERRRLRRHGHGQDHLPQRPPQGGPRLRAPDPDRGHARGAPRPS